MSFDVLGGFRFIDLDEAVDLTENVRLDTFNPIAFTSNGLLKSPVTPMRAVLTDDSKRLSAEESAQFAAARATVRTQHRDRSELLRDPQYW